MSQPQPTSQALHASLDIAFDYTRSLGPTLSAFASALAERRILGARSADGLVHAPPFEYDPVTAAPPAELVEVGPGGTVVSWSWMQRPLDGQPLDHPFGWALIRLDGADNLYGCRHHLRLERERQYRLEYRGQLDGRRSAQ